MFSAERESAEQQRKLELARTCCVQVSAKNRSYRDAMLAYAHALKAGSPWEAEKAEVATARRAQRDARAEAIALLDKIVTLLSRTTVIMRLSLGVIDEPPPWFQPDPPRA